MNPGISECYFGSFLRCKLSGEQFSFSTFADNLCHAFFRHRLVRSNCVRSCQNYWPSFVLWTGGSSALHLVQVSNEFDSALSLVS